MTSYFSPCLCLSEFSPTPTEHLFVESSSSLVASSNTFYLRLFLHGCPASQYARPYVLQRDSLNQITPLKYFFRRKEPLYRLLSPSVRYSRFISEDLSEHLFTIFAATTERKIARKKVLLCTSKTKAFAYTTNTGSSRPLFLVLSAGI